MVVTKKKGVYKLNGMLVADVDSNGIVVRVREGLGSASYVLWL